MVNINKLKSINFLKYSKFYFAVSSFICIVSILFIAFKGFDKGIDFEGGNLVEIKIDDENDISSIRKSLNNKYSYEFSIQEFGASNILLIRYNINNKDKKYIDSFNSQLVEHLKNNGSIEIRRNEFLGPVIGAEMLESSFYAIIFSLIGIFVYIWFRFEWQFSIISIMALMHDVIIMLGMFSIFGITFSLTSVAAILIIAGYSINDTVVIFDRVRENMNRYSKSELFEILNISISDTLSRTLITSLTTLFAVVVLFLFGGASLRDFSFALIIGIVVGTYSSNFFAVPMLQKLNPIINRDDKEDI